MNFKVVSQLSQHIFLLFNYFISARHNLVFDLCREIKNTKNPWFYSSLTYSFVAIHSSAHPKNADFHFISPDISQLSGLMNEYTYVKRGLTKKLSTYIKINF